MKYPIHLALAAATALLASMAAASELLLENVPGFFQQDLPETDPAGFDYVRVAAPTARVRAQLLTCPR